MGASPKVLEYLRKTLTEGTLAIYPEYSEIKEELAAFFGVEPDDFILTNGTDEAIAENFDSTVNDEDRAAILGGTLAAVAGFDASRKLAVERQHA